MRLRADYFLSSPQGGAIDFNSLSKKVFLFLINVLKKVG
jgi:hypothetical protein